MKSSNNRVAAVVLAAGSGSRTGLGYNKMLYASGGQTVLERTLDAFAGTSVTDFVVVAAEADFDRVTELLQGRADTVVTTGGPTRGESVRRGLCVLPPCDVVVIHDGARPFVTRDVIEESIRSAVLYGSGIAAVKTTDTVEVVCDGKVISVPDRDTLVNVQTPQTFRTAEIVDAYARVTETYTDDAAVYLHAGYTPRIVASSAGNVKITTAEDLLRLSAEEKVGMGFDVHPLVEGRPLILGGVTIPYTRGLLGHSDADVLTHAVMDALLSAAGLPDIGVLFPDTDPALLGASSVGMLQTVMAKLCERNLSVGNVSCVVMAEKPKLAPHIAAIRATLAAAMGVACGDVNVSATTTEKLGIIGEGKGMAASAVALLVRHG